jgi:hypothetical protein
VLLQRRQQEAVATARAVGHRAQLVLARQRVRRQRLQGQAVGPLAWFAVQGKIDQQVVRAVWADGRLCCDRLLEVRARRLVVDLGPEFGSDDPARRYRASLQVPPVAVLPLIRTCDLTTAMWCALGFAEPGCWTSCHGGYGLELYRGQHAEAAVASLPVVEDLQVLKDRVGELDAGAPASLVEEFDLHP